MRSMTKAAVLLASLALVAGVASARPKEFKPPVHEVTPSLDKVLMESFVSEPATIPPGTAQVVLRATVKNVTNSNLATGYVLNGLKLKIFRTQPTPEVLEMETTINNLAIGATQSVGARVNIGPGVRKYKAVVDPDNTLHEPLQQRFNNERRIELTIPQVSGQQAPAPGSQPRLETQQLDYARAKNAGAQFSNGVEGQKGGCGSCGQSANNRPDYSVLFWAPCVFSPNGVRLTPEVFTGFHLKNGWKVKGYDFREITTSSGDWQWRKTPTIGTDDPSARMHIWVDAGGEVSVPLVITIEGPAGTNPYQ